MSNGAQTRMVCAGPRHVLRGFQLARGHGCHLGLVPVLVTVAEIAKGELNDGSRYLR